MKGQPGKSKKRFAANSVGRRHDPPIFFVDRSLGKKIVPGILADNSFRVEVHDDHFPENCPDTEWLEIVAKRGWVILSKDKLIRKRTLEREALIRFKAAAFILTSGNITGAEMGEAFVRAKNRMVRFLAKHKRPFIAAVTRSGAISKLDL